MISINRTECPACLAESPSKGDEYRNKEVVSKLWNMQNKKCCYCETIIPVHGHNKAVEHFRPKSVFKYLRNEWNNLLLVCPQCNGKKSNKFPIELTKVQNEFKIVYIIKEEEGTVLLIDPSNKDIDPENHLNFIVDTRKKDYGLIIVHNKSKLGDFTINTIGLQGEYYTGKHRNYILDVLLLMYHTLLKAKNQGEQELIITTLARFKMVVSCKSEYTALSRTFVKFYKIDKRFGLQIPNEK